MNQTHIAAIPQNVIAPQSTPPIFSTSHNHQRQQPLTIPSLFQTSVNEHHELAKKFTQQLFKHFKLESAQAFESAVAAACSHDVIGTLLQYKMRSRKNRDL